MLQQAFITIKTATYFLRLDNHNNLPYNNDMNEIYMIAHNVLISNNGEMEKKLVLHKEFGAFVDVGFAHSICDEANKDKPEMQYFVSTIYIHR
jgi:hypothetical protein